MSFEPGVLLRFPPRRARRGPRRPTAALLATSGTFSATSSIGSRLVRHARTAAARRADVGLPEAANELAASLVDAAHAHVFTERSGRM